MHHIHGVFVERFGGRRSECGEIFREGSKLDKRGPRERETLRRRRP